MPRPASVKLEGAADVSAAFKNLNGNVKRAVREITRESLDEVKRGTEARIPTGPGKLGKHTRDTFKREMAPGGLSGQVRSSWFIARLREFGHNIARRHGNQLGASGRKAGTTVLARVPARPALYPAFALVRARYLRRLEAAIYGITRGGLR